jgi:hypothetical protein
MKIMQHNNGYNTCIIGKLLPQTNKTYTLNLSSIKQNVLPLQPAEKRREDLLNLFKTHEKEALYVLSRSDVKEGAPAFSVRGQAHEESPLYVTYR